MCSERMEKARLRRAMTSALRSQKSRSSGRQSSIQWPPGGLRGLAIVVAGQASLVMWRSFQERVRSATSTGRSSTVDGEVRGAAPVREQPVVRSNAFRCSGQMHDAVVDLAVGERAALVRADRRDGAQRAVAQPEDRDLLAVDGERAALAERDVVHRRRAGVLAAGPAPVVARHHGHPRRLSARSAGMRQHLQRQRGAELAAVTAVSALLHGST